jgi:hypothetical protein
MGIPLASRCFETLQLAFFGSISRLSLDCSPTFRSWGGGAPLAVAGGTVWGTSGGRPSKRRWRCQGGWADEEEPEVAAGAALAGATMCDLKSLSLFGFGDTTYFDHRIFVIRWQIFKNLSSYSNTNQERNWWGTVWSDLRNWSRTKGGEVWTQRAVKKSMNTRNTTRYTPSP